METTAGPAVSVHQRLRAVEIPAYLVVAPFATAVLWVIGWALVLAAFDSWTVAGDVGALACWRGALFAFDAKGGHERGISDAAPPL
jgi:hypothetical protein